MNTKSVTEIYNKISSQYASQYFDDLTEFPIVDEFLRLLPAGAAILDAGCGVGQFAKHMSEQGCKVIGVDVSDGMLDIARKKAPTCRFEKMDMRNIEFPSESFDGILAAYSLIHIPSEELNKTLLELYKVLKKGGYILTITQKGSEDHWIDEPFSPGDKTFFNFFTRERLNEYVQNAGFEVVSQKELSTSDTYAESDTIIYTILKKEEV